MDRKEAKLKIDVLWNQIRDLYSQNFDIKESRLYTILGKDHMPQLVLGSKRNRPRKSKLEVICDGEVYSMEDPNISANDVLIEVIQKATVAEVEALNIITDGGKNLITNYRQGMDLSSYRRIGAKVVFVKTGIDEKYRQIRQIVDMLGLNYDVYMK